MAKTVHVAYSTVNQSSGMSPSAMLDVQQSQQVPFLGVVMDSTLNWRAHIDSLCKKLSSVVYLIKALSYLVDRETLKLVYYALFESRLRYAVVCWGNSSDSTRVFKIQKRAVRAMVGVWDQRVSCRPLFVDLDILPLPAVFILESLLFTRRRLDAYSLNEDVHRYETRRRGDIFQERCRLTKSQKSPFHLGAKLYNKLPRSAKVETLSLIAFKRSVKALLQGCRPYSVQEYMDARF